MTSGELRIEGRKVNDLPPHKRNVNTVFQNYELFPHMTVAQNVAFGLRMEKLSTEEVTRRTGEYLELVGLAGLSGRLPSEMSGGQQQRVALARALRSGPPSSSSTSRQRSTSSPQADADRARADPSPSARRSCS
jgi:ABC-type Fe3+/spermidine/putrescine transport system ATPase subunit